MKKCFLLLFVLVWCSSIGFSQGRKMAWIEKRFADAIMERKEIVSEYLFPIIGFEKEGEDLYILTYGGDLQPIQIREKGRRKEIIDIEETINIQEWPLDLVKEFDSSTVLVEERNNTINVTIITNKKIYKLSFINSLNGNNFSTLLEMQGWLLNYLIPPIVRWGE